MFPGAEAQSAAEVARRGALLDAVARDISPHLDADPEQTLGMLARLVVPELADWTLVTLVEADGTLRDLGAAHRDPAQQDAVTRYASIRLEALKPGSYPFEVAASGRRQLLQAGALDAVLGIIAPGEARDIIIGLAPVSLLIEPLVSRGRTLALMTLYRDRSWDAASLEAVAEVATRVALALDNSRAYGQAQAAQAQALRYARRMRLLGEVSELLSATLDQRLAVTELARLVVPELGDWCIVTVNAGADRDRDLGWAHRDPALQDTLGDYAHRQFDAMSPGAPVAVCLRTGRPVITTQLGDVLTVSPDADEARLLLARLRPAAVAVFPLKAGDLVMGAIAFVTGAERGQLGEQELETAAEVARRAGLALDNARLYGQQRRLAETLQRSLLTEPPHSDRFDIAVRYVPAATEAQVGGDWYDAFEQPDGSLVIVIGDVIGHDSAAAATMGQLRGLLRGIGFTTGARPANLLRRLDEAMDGLQMQTSATAVVARLETEGDAVLLRWSNAGHPPPMLITPEGVVRPLEVPEIDLLLGVDASTTRRETVCTLVPGSTVLLYTDGLVERRGASLDTGLTALAETLACLAVAPLEALCEQVLKDVPATATDDDVAIVAVRLRA